MPVLAFGLRLKFQVKYWSKFRTSVKFNTNIWIFVCVGSPWRRKSNNVKMLLVIMTLKWSQNSKGPKFSLFAWPYQLVGFLPVFGGNIKPLLSSCFQVFRKRSTEGVQRNTVGEFGWSTQSCHSQGRSSPRWSVHGKGNQPSWRSFSRCFSPRQRWVLLIIWPTCVDVDNAFR